MTLKPATKRCLTALTCLATMFVLPADLRPGDTSPAGSALLRSVVMHGPAGSPRMALTFDSNMTDAMLRWLDTGKIKSYANVGVVDELQRSHTPATFFLSGKWVERYPELTRRIAADPNFELASHSYAHIGFTIRCYRLGVLPTRQMAADVERSFQVLAPFGGRNAHNGGIVVLHITEANAPRTADALPTVITSLRERGYQLVTLSELLAHRPR